MSNINSHNTNNNTINNKNHYISIPTQPSPIIKKSDLNTEYKQELDSNITSIIDMKNMQNNNYAVPYTKNLTQTDRLYSNNEKFFDSKEFNKNFDKYIESQSKNRLINEQIKLNDLNSITNIKIYPYQLPLNKILINIKNTWFNLFDNIITNNKIKFDFNDDTIFYISITLIVVALLYIILLFIFE